MEIEMTEAEQAITSGGVDEEHPVLPAVPAAWQANPELLEELQRKQVSWLYRESDVPPYSLPDPLRCEDGSQVSTREEWERKRRPETLELFRRFVYGRSPTAPPEMQFEVVATDPDAVGGKATLKQVAITSRDGDKSFRFETVVLVPNQRREPTPAFLLINNRKASSAGLFDREEGEFWPVEEILERGYATAVFRTHDLDPDTNEDAARAAGVRGVWPAGSSSTEAPGEAWATLGAWAWGASRVLDYLETEPAIDGAKVAVVGHSRGGKTALWAAAQDERFALAVSNNSGCGGAALSRRCFGETVEAINRGFPYWFCGNFRQFNGREEALPVDQHQLLSLLAPRAVYVASADADFWADQRGEFLALAHTSPVYALHGHPGFRPEEMPPLDTPVVRGQQGYHIRTGGHDLTAYDWRQFLNFADQLWGTPGIR
jgi:hypothetical protein